MLNLSKGTNNQSCSVPTYPNMQNLQKKFHWWCEAKYRTTMDHLTIIRIWWLLEVGTPRSRNTPRTPRLEAPSFEVYLWTYSIFMGFKNCLQNDILIYWTYLHTWASAKSVFSYAFFSKHSSFFHTFIVGETNNTSIAGQMFVKELIDISEKQNG